jgi:predicted phosphodiesterase
MGKELSISKKGAVKRVIVTPDKHFPLADMPAIRALCKAIKKVKPQAYIDLGDVGEWSSVSAWKYKRKVAPPVEFIIKDLKQDIKDVNEGMDIIDKALDSAGCTERHFTEGNHDDWVNKFVEKYPYLQQYKLNKVLKLKERGYTYHPFGTHLKIGKLYFYHGHQYGGQYHTANHLRKLGCNIMYGHWHDLQQMSVTHMDGPKAAWSIGCLKNMEAEANEWLSNRKINWAHAFAIVDFYDKAGNFTVDVVQIIDGKCSIWGELLDGNE